MSERSATVYIDYQQRASEFSVGDAVAPFGADSMVSGRVVSVFPAIGMVDVEFAYGNKRYPVEDLQRIRQDSPVNEPHHDSVPGGAGSVEVPGGPDPSRNSPDTPLPTFMVDDDEEDAEREQRRLPQPQVGLHPSDRLRPGASSGASRARLPPAGPLYPMRPCSPGNWCAGGAGASADRFWLRLRLAVGGDP